MSRSGETLPETAARIHTSAAILQNRAFVELSRVLASGEPAVLSSALPLVVRGAGVPSAVIFGASHDDVVLVAAQSVPLKLRAYLEEPSFSRAPDFLARRALAQRRTVIDANVFGADSTAGALTALEEAAWQSGIAVPILAAGAATGVILAGARTGAASGSTVTFLEAMASLLGAALGKPPSKPAPPLPSSVACSGCVGAVVESLSALGREVAGQHALLRDMCSREGAPPEADALLGRARSLGRTFRRVSEAVLNLPSVACAHARRPSSMTSVVDLAVQAARPALAEAGAELEVICAPSCDFEGDSEMMALAVRHLLVNAAESFVQHGESDFAPSKGRCVRVCARHEGANAAVHVEDSGAGVPHDLRARIFEPTVSTKGSCRGLGLSLARHIVESHGGWMELGASELGGTRVSIQVPARSAALDEMRRATTVPQIVVPQAARGARRGA